METFSALLALCEGNSPVTRSFDVFFDLHLNKRLSKQSWGWWFETHSRSLWRHCNESILRPTIQWRCYVFDREVNNHQARIVEQSITKSVLPLTHVWPCQNMVSHVFLSSNISLNCAYKITSGVKFVSRPKHTRLCLRCKYEPRIASEIIDQWYTEM